MLDWLIVRFEALDGLIYSGSKDKMAMPSLVSLTYFFFLQFGGHLDSLIGS